MAVKMQYNLSSFSERTALAQTIDKRKENVLSVVDPELAAQWHPAKNGSLTPEMVTKASNKKVWWQCRQGHEWQATISSRSNGNGCPYCSGRNAVKGINDLATIHPNLAEQWHPIKNGDLMPDMVTAGSSKKVWWRCRLGHEWQTRIVDRNHKSGCPYCSGHKVWKGFNDLATANPGLATQWHPTKNGSLTPEMVTKTSNKKVWWQCEEGHEWQAAIRNRSYGCNCPYCSNRGVLKHSNDLVTVNASSLAAEWHPTKNGELTPDMVTAGSSKKVWWKCKLGHEWQATINSRNHGNSCPYCSGHKVWKDFNDLATVNPSLAAEWHPIKNGELTPDMVALKCNKKVWWSCKMGHEWQATINNRSKGTGCPICYKLNRLLNSNK